MLVATCLGYKLTLGALKVDEQQTGSDVVSGTWVDDAVGDSQPDQR